MPGNVKVLLVDDSAMVLEMLRQSLAPLASVSTATDGADALLKAIDELPDLIITDYAMPGMDGRQLFEKLKSRPATARIPVIIAASKTDLNERLKMLQDAVEDFVEKPFFVKQATARIKRVIDKIGLEKMAREAAGDGSVRGNLAQMSIMDLLQSLEMGHKTCSLVVSNNGSRCEMYFTEGQLSHAVFGALRGDEAVYKVLTWTEGSFTIDFSAKSDEQTTTRSTQGLLMEGLRLIDEANRDADTEENVLET